MVNPEHLEILKQGVEVWKKWRKDNPDVMPELDYTDLQRIELDGADLSYTELNAA